MKNNENKDITIRHRARDESGKEHIAVSTHGLQVRDIESISKILKKPELCEHDLHNKNYEVYYGKRGSKHDSTTRNKGLYLKVVTSVKLDGNNERSTTAHLNFWFRWSQRFKDSLSL